MENFNPFQPGEDYNADTGIPFMGIMPSYCDPLNLTELIDIYHAVEKILQTPTFDIQTLDI
jgi:hypothetical protein